VAESKADLLLHPIRLRIIQAFVPPKRLTAQAIGAVPLATLYRHLNKLTKGGVLAVVERRQVRGTTEKVYALLAGGAYLTPGDLAEASTEDHLRYFTTFVASLLGDNARYLERDHLDFVGDGVGYRQLPLYLSDEEFTRMVVELNVVLAPLAANGPAPGRRRRLLSTVMMPVEDAPEIVEETRDR
jgi:hypothetical protein